MTSLQVEAAPAASQPFRIEGENVIYGRQTVRFQRQALKIFEYLLDRVDTIVTKEDLYQAVWETPRPEPKIMDVLVSRIRRSLECLDDEDAVAYLVTVHGVGFCMLSALEGPAIAELVQKINQARLAPQPVKLKTRLDRIYTQGL